MRRFWWIALVVLAIASAGRGAEVPAGAEARQAYEDLGASTRSAAGRIWPGCGRVCTPPTLAHGYLRGAICWRCADSHLTTR